MKYHIFCLGLPLLLILFSCSDNDQFFDGGNGTEVNPYQISTIEQLQAINDEEYLDKHFIQVRDIDAANSLSDGEPIKLNPIGSRETPFTGNYNGDGHSIAGISDLFEDRTDLHVGLFGYVHNGAIENLYLINPSSNKFRKAYGGELIYESGVMINSYIPELDVDNLQVMGGLVGYNDGGSINNVHSEISLASRRHHIGGLAGYSSGNIVNSSAKANITAFGFGGGLVAINQGVVEDSFAGGWISGTGAAGGLVGMNDGGQIFRSQSDGEVQSGFRTGGFVGINSGSIESSNAMGSVRSDRGPGGGFAGINSGNISTSYSIIEVWNFEPGESIGGFIGLNMEDGRINDSYAAGLITIVDGIGTVVGGFLGNNMGQSDAAYWDTESTGQNQGVGEGDPEGATGLTTAQMTGPAAEANMPEFDWVNVWRTTDGYPVLRWQEGE